MALLVYEAGRCPSCGNFDTVIDDDPTDVGAAMVTWPNGRSIKVHQMRCLACGAVDAVKRDWMKAHEKDQTFPGQALPADGRMFVGRPATEEDLDG